MGKTFLQNHPHNFLWAENNRFSIPIGILMGILIPTEWKSSNGALRQGCKISFVAKLSQISFLRFFDNSFWHFWWSVQNICQHYWKKTKRQTTGRNKHRLYFTYFKNAFTFAAIFGNKKNRRLAISSKVWLSEALVARSFTSNAYNLHTNRRRTSNRSKNAMKKQAIISVSKKLWLFEVTPVF